MTLLCNKCNTVNVDSNTTNYGTAQFRLSRGKEKGSSTEAAIIHLETILSQILWDKVSYRAHPEFGR